MAKKKLETRRKEVRCELENQLKAKGAANSIYRDKIDDYMELWDLKEMYKEDIRKNGLRIDGADNPSAKQLQSTIRLMDQMLDKMNLTTENVVSEDCDVDAL
jgi:hypothetical protein